MFDLLRRLSSAREAATERDGFLSYAGEFHAAVIGLGVGASSAVVQEPVVAASVVLATFGLRGAGRARRQLKKVGKPGIDESALNEIRREPWYATGATLAGYIAAAVFAPGTGAEAAVGELLRVALEVV